MRGLALILIAFSLTALSGCAIIGGIFKAGAFVGIIALLILIVIVAMLVGLLAR